MTIHPTQLIDAKARQSLFAFVWRCYLELHPGSDQRFIPNWHVEAICHALERVGAGDCRRLLITVPPRHLKSICTAVGFVAWMLGRNPSMKIMVASYGHDLAVKHSRDCRIVMESAFYRRVFPATTLSAAREVELETATRGGRKAVSLGGAVTGLGADLLIIDDLMKAADAQSEVERRKVKEFYEGTLFSRLNNKQDARIVAIQQRLHEDDLAAYLIEKGTFEHLNLRAIAEEDEEIPVGRGREHRRARGEALFPQNEPLATLEATRRDIGPNAFSAQYPQNPTAPGGNRIRWEWWGRYEEQEDRGHYQLIVQSWDTAMSAEPTSDFAVGTTWGYRERKWYLLDVLRERLDYPELKREVFQTAKAWRADRIIIENAGTGIPLIRELRREYRLEQQVAIYRPLVDKRVRLEAQLAKLETGNFLLPVTADWLPAFKSECEAFPNGRHDDQVDSLSQFLDWLGWRKGVSVVQRAPTPPR